MSIISKVTEAIVQFAPDRDRDQLSEADRLIGKPVDRIDGRVKVTGGATFTTEFPLENLAYASLAYSTIAKGTMKSIDVAKVEEAPGVLAVITHRNAPEIKDPPLFIPSRGSDAAGSKANILNTDNTDEIFWNGQPVAVIVADTLDRAEHAASLVKGRIRSRVRRHFVCSTARLTRKFRTNIMGKDSQVIRGVCRAALTGAKFKASITFTRPRDITTMPSISPR